MKKLIALSVLCFTVVSSFAQGIVFEEGEWKAAVAKAKAENKLIYLDIYTTWCGPCRQMAKNIFPQKEAGDKYNALFVNCRLDAEKGEGIDIAKKYEVNGYPTNLFIDPKNEAVVFRSMGAPQEVAGFNENADIALQEYKDPMTWDMYTAKFKTGKYDQQFLKAYLTKAERLGRNNDEILDAYIKTINTSDLSEQELYFLADQVQTANNDVIAVLAKNSGRLDKRYPARENGDTYWKSQLSSWHYATMERAVSTKDEKLMAALEKSITRYEPEGAKEKVAGYWVDFYTKTENKARAAGAMERQGNLLMARSLASFKTEDEKALKELHVAIRSQLKEMNVPDSNMEKYTEASIKGNAMAFPSMQAANKLNSLAWTTYEDNSATGEQLTRAQQWAQKAMEFSEAYPKTWAMYADTYAHLLYRTGKKDEAIRLQETAVSRAKENKSEDLGSLEESLDKMKAGKL